MENIETGIQNSKSEITRRGMLKVGVAASALGAAALAVKGAGLPTSPLATNAAVPAEERLVKTTCAMCPSGCGLEVRVVDGKAVKVEGNPLHPLNQGVCCLKGQASLEALYSPERIERPRLQTGARGSGDWKEISWDDALSLLAGKLSELRQAGEPQTLALVHGETRGQLRALIQRFAEAFGTPNVVSRESLGEQVVRQACFLTQGVRGLPAYDLNNASYVMAFGGNLLESSRNVIGALASLAFMRRGRPQRGKLVTVHPRLSLTGIKSDEWVPIRPGTYAALALGMANVMLSSKLYDETFVRDFTFGFEDFQDEDGAWHMGFKRLVQERYPLDQVASITGVPAETIARLAGEFATNRPAVAVLPAETGELCSGNSLYTAMAIHALNALVGSIDTPGGVLIQRFPQAAAWPEYSPDETARAGLAQERLDGAGSAPFPLAATAITELAGRILAGEPYPAKVLLLLNANPVYDLPGSRFAEALLKVPFVASFASTLDESAAHSDLILPASTFFETWGDDYLEGTGYAGISLRRPVVQAVHDTRDPADVLLEIAGRLDGPLAAALPWRRYEDLVKARWSVDWLDWTKVEENGCWSEMVYFHAAPGSRAWGRVLGQDRRSAPKDGRFDFFSRELFALFRGAQGQESLDLACLPHFELPAQAGADPQTESGYPFLLVTQPLITQPQNWTGILPTLQECYGLQVNARWSSWVEINPRAAEAMHIQDGDLVWVESPYGRVQAPARLYEGIWINALYLPPGQGHRTLLSWGRNAPENMVVGVNPNGLVSPASETLSGQAVLGPTRVKVTK
jgi:anaerobic selenocysteine-containing dehydrogenase